MKHRDNSKHGLDKLDHLERWANNGPLPIDQAPTNLSLHVEKSAQRHAGLEPRPTEDELNT